MIVELYHMVNSREFIANICKFGLGESLTLELKQYTPDSPQGPQGYGAWSNLQVSMGPLEKLSEIDQRNPYKTVASIKLKL